MPRLVLFTIAGRGFALNDLLPPAHAVVALNKVFALGARIGDVLYELGALTILSALYFAIGGVAVPVYTSEGGVGPRLVPRMGDAIRPSRVACWSKP